MLKKHLKCVIAVAILSSIATLAYADDVAPVYDADHYQPQFDNQAAADNQGGGGDNVSDSSAVTSPAPSSSYSPPSSGDAYSQQANAQQTNDVSSQANDNTADNSADNTSPPIPQTTADQSQSQGQSQGLDQRVTRVEQQVNNIQNKNASAKMEALQGEVQMLRGQVEQLTHQLQQVKKDDHSTKLNNQPHEAQVSMTPNDTIPAAPKTVADKQKLKSKSKQPVVPIAPQQQQEDATNTTPDSSAQLPAANPNQQPNVAEEQQIYQTAYDLIKAKKYNDAIATLQKMLQKYPSGQFAANAHYWLGELYGLLDKKEQSASEFSNVINSFPDSPKVSDAQLKLGLIYAAQFKWPEAKIAFKDVISRYPGTASSRLAAEQLRQIKQAGH